MNFDSQTKSASWMRRVIRRHWGKLLFATTMLGLLAITPFGRLVCWCVAEELNEHLHRRSFDSAAWKASLVPGAENPLRQRMVDDLLRRHKLVGLTRDELVALLGVPPETSYFREDYQFVYWLGPERGHFFGIDSEWLAIRLGENGRVAEARIVHD